MFRIAVCDDVNEQLQDLHKKVWNYIEQHKIAADIELYEQSRLLKYDIQEGKYFDFILSDIEMPYVDGMELAKEIRAYLPEVIVIFITAYIKYAVDAYELSVFRYIPKDTLQERLPRALDDAMVMLKLQSQQSYMIQMPTRMEKIPLKQIIYIQKDGKNALLVLSNGKVTSVRKSLNTVYEEIHSDEFVFVDRSSIINIAHILGIQRNKVQLSNGVNLVISHSRLEMIKDKLNEFWSTKI